MLFHTQNCVRLQCLSAFSSFATKYKKRSLCSETIPKFDFFPIKYKLMLKLVIIGFFSHYYWLELIKSARL